MNKFASKPFTGAFTPQFFTAVAVLLLTLLGGARTASAHHSNASYDLTKTITLKGTVKTFQWSNPHVVAYVEIDGKEKEPPQVWTFEMTSPGNLTRLGHNKRSLNPGDHITVECNPARDGSHSGWAQKITTPSGQVMTFHLEDLEKPGLR
jgi:hypothetical protein